MGNTFLKRCHHFFINFVLSVKRTAGKIGAAGGAIGGNGNAGGEDGGNGAAGGSGMAGGNRASTVKSMLRKPS